MPRHLSRFQRDFSRWFHINVNRFSIQVSLTALKNANVMIEFANHPKCLRITANESNHGVWVLWNEMPWDALLDLDVIPVKTSFGDGFTCRLCEGKVARWNSLEALWSDHLFEPFLLWVNKDFA